jgi:hypothetical protein
MVGFPFECERLDERVGRYCSMPFDSEIAHALDVQAIGRRSSATVTPYKRKRVVPLSRFEPWKACAWAALHPSKEGPEGAIDVAKNFLAGIVVCNATVASGSDAPELSVLVIVGDRNSAGVPGRSALLQSSVVEPAGFIDLRMKGSILRPVRVNAVSERPAHL